MQNHRFVDLYESTSQLLGKGAFAQVYLARRRSNQEQVAVKVMSKISSNELEILCKLNRYQHQNVMRVLDIFDQGGQTLVVQEYCNGGTLFEYIQNQQLPEEQIMDILEQVAFGLDYLHNLNIIHRDIKPENILRALVNGKWLYKITDFGFSTSNLTPSTQSGTAYYVSPEILDGRYKGPPYLVDVWALGIMFDEMLHRRPFYDGQTEEEVFLKIRNEPYYIRSPEYSQKSLLTPKRKIINNILQGLIVRDPLLRQSLSWLLTQIKEYRYLQVPKQVETEKQWAVLSKSLSLCNFHNQEILFRMPIKKQDTIVMVPACAKCLKIKGIYEIDTLSRKVDEAIAILTTQGFEYNVLELKNEIKAVTDQYLEFTKFKIKEEELQLSFEVAMQNNYLKLKSQFTYFIQQLQQFKDNSFTTSTNEEQWIINVAQNVQDNPGNEFVFYIKEELLELREQVVEQCQQLTQDYLQKILFQIEKLI